MIEALRLANWLEKYGASHGNNELICIELRRLADENERLRTAAKAVIDRWETPLWKDAPATAGFIYALRDAMGCGPLPAPPKESAVDHTEHGLGMVLQTVEDLIHAADRAGVRVSLTRRPLKPLAMGHGEYVVQTWPARTSS